MPGSQGLCVILQLALAATSASNAIVSVGHVVQAEGL